MLGLPPVALPVRVLPYVSHCDAVQIMAVRERVKRHIVKRTSDLYQKVLDEINTVKRLLDGVKRVPESSPVLPPRAAQAFRAGHLSYRLEMTWETLQRVQARRSIASCLELDCWL